MLPAFRGIAPLRGIEGLSNPRGFTIIDKHQRNPKYKNVFAVGYDMANAVEAAIRSNSGLIAARIADKGGSEAASED